MQGPQMMLCLRNCGMPVLDHLSLFLVKENGFIISCKVIWNRYEDIGLFFLPKFNIYGDGYSLHFGN